MDLEHDQVSYCMFQIWLCLKLTWIWSVWTSNVLNLTMLIWDMVRVCIICLKLNHNPNVFMLTWNMVGFWGVECTKSDYIPDLIWDIPSWIWDDNHISDMGIPKSKIQIWECPKSDSEQNRVWSTTPIKWLLIIVTWIRIYE